jgi:hypothetical protein
LIVALIDWISSKFSFAHAMRKTVDTSEFSSVDCRNRPLRLSHGSCAQEKSTLGCSEENSAEPGRSDRSHVEGH